MKITINETSDWKKLVADGLGTVVDPLVFRCGELFLKGANGATSSNAVWELLDLNLHGIGMFFDALILQEKLPVFNYGDTFDMKLNFDQRILTRINDYDNKQVLHDVDVGWNAYNAVKDAALDELKKIFDGQENIPAETFEQVSRELSAADYQWSPSLKGLEAKLDYNGKLLADYLLGGLIFQGYAQQMEGEHLIQPKRSRIFLAFSMQSPSAGYEAEKHLFEELKNRSNSDVADIPWRPTFFPYLLSKADTPDQILREVVKMRNSPEVKDYRQWFNEIIEDFEGNGRISNDKRNDVKAIAESIDRRIGKTPSMPNVEIKMQVAAAIPGEVNLTPALKGMWGWFLDSLPGKRYRKLLTRAIVADGEYFKIGNRIKTVWNAG
jgi:hypothetical protein